LAALVLCYFAKGASLRTQYAAALAIGCVDGMANDIHIKDKVILSHSHVISVVS